MPILSELATLFLRMCTWTGKSIWNCFWFLDLFFFFNHIGLIALSQQPFLRWAFCQFYSLVNCINHTARLRSQQSATQPALKSRTFLDKHIHLFVRTDGRTNPAFVHSSECAVSPYQALCDSGACLSWLSSTTTAAQLELPSSLVDPPRPAREISS